MSLSDMIFGGKLTSILVCQSCKHVSQTFEDFNDISLSLKAEDYQERKRDRLKNLAKRLTSFPATFPSSTLVVSPEIPRPSSVPPSPSMRDGTQLVGHEEPPIADDPRRRSLDILATVGQEGGYVPSTSTSKEDTTSLESDKPSVEANEVVKRKHIEIVDPVKEGRKEKKDDSWTKIGRRITMSVRLTKGKEHTSRSKDRHSQDLSQATTSLGVPHSPDNIKRSSIDGVSLPTSTPRTSVSEMLQGSAPSILLSRPSTPSMQKDPESTSSSRSRSPSRAPFSTIRGKSPKPPKATSAETEYLRRILADITPGSSTNAFGLLKPTFHHNSSNRSVSAGSTVSTAQTLWLSMSQFSGIEECLRMFTGVEILDGDNMVGCRRCWKIANGTLPPGQPSDGQENADDSSSSSENDSPVAPPPNTWEERNPRQSLPPLSPSMAHIPTSISTPTVSLYPYLSNSDSSSVSSLHTDVALLDSDAEPVASTPDQSASSLASTGELDSGLKRPTTPGGFPIPVIATTGPDSPNAPSPLRDSASPVTPPEPVDPTSSSSSDKDVTPIAHPTPRLAQVVARLPPSSSGDSLVIPKARHGLHRSDADSADESSGSESESSIARSTDTSTSLEPSHDAADPNKSCSSLPVKKPSRPKPVIMRPAYKRYLIGVPPPVLVIHLKRFQQISKTHMMSFSHGFKKIDDYVTFPEYLDLTPYLAPKKEDFGLGKKGKAKMKGKYREKDEKCMYRLYAVVVHIGNMVWSLVTCLSC
jgi:ubiquitin carboxyl-terminal hydrolase 16/45